MPRIKNEPPPEYVTDSCSYCGLVRVVRWTGRRYICETCWGEHMGDES